MKVELGYIDEIVGAADRAYDILEDAGKKLKGDQMNELKRSGFDLDRVAADLLRWQRQFRVLTTKLNNPVAENA